MIERTQQPRLGLERIPRASPECRLFCFPYAGAGAWYYRSWARRLPESVEMCALRWPGRETLRAVPSLRRIESLVAWALEVAEPWLSTPFAFFGHSLGALVAFALARELRRRHLPQPSLLLVSGHRAPQRACSLARFTGLGEAEFMERVTALGGTPPEVFAQPELRALFIPTLRADFEAWETYSYAEEPAFQFAVRAYGGTEDPLLSGDDLEAWQHQTTGSFRVRRFEGNHFYFQPDDRPLLSELSTALLQDAQAAPNSAQLLVS